MRVDLHTHTKFSADGHGTPQQVFETARDAGIGLIAVTEHNSCAHIEECLALSTQAGMPDILPGVEVSCMTPLTGEDEIHLLCYFVDRTVQGWRSAVFQKLMAELAECQQQNLARTATRLGLSADELHTAIAWCYGDGHLHPSVPPSIYFLKRYFSAMQGDRTALSAACRELKAAGDWILYPDAHCFESLMTRSDCRWFLAHPKRYGWSDVVLEKLVKSLADKGLAGIETNYRGYMEATPELAAIARRYTLLRSAGTDLHDFRAIAPGKYAAMVDGIALSADEATWLHAIGGKR